jgi:predicted transposase YdaD
MIDDALRKGKAEGKAEGKVEGRAEGKVEGRAEGKVEGKAEGKVEGRAEVAIQLLKLGISLEDIIKSTGFTSEEIYHLQK